MLRGYGVDDIAEWPVGVGPDAADVRAGRHTKLMQIDRHKDGCEGGEAGGLEEVSAQEKTIALQLYKLIIIGVPYRNAQLRRNE